MKKTYQQRLYQPPADCSAMENSKLHSDAPNKKFRPTAKKNRKGKWGSFSVQQ